MAASGTADDGREVLLLVVDAGGGHRAAANALLAAVDQSGPGYRLRVENLQAILDPLDPVRRLTGRRIESLYNAMVRRRRTGHLVPLLRGLQWGIRFMRRPLARQVAAHLSAARPDLVVSMLPNFNGVLRDAVEQACPDVPFVVLLTDLADFPPHFWLESGLDGALVGSEEAAGQARGCGLAEEGVVRTSGMVLHPRFYAEGGEALRARVRAELGLRADAFVVLLLFGGKGAPEILPLAQMLLAEDVRWHVIAVCGDNPRLHERMGAVETAARGRLHRLGFTDRIPDLLGAADLLLTKPGPGSLAEAFHRRVPVVVTLDKRTIPQERFNATFVQEHGLGVVVESWRDMPAVVRELFARPERLATLRSALDALPENRAVWEVLAHFGRWCGAAGAGAPESAPRHEGVTERS